MEEKILEVFKHCNVELTKEHFKNIEVRERANKKSLYIVIRYDKKVKKSLFKMLENKSLIERELKAIIDFDELCLRIKDRFYKRVFYTLEKIVLLGIFPFAILVGAIIDFCVDTYKKIKTKKTKIK
ncbi:hypothetical protein [Helicobacter cetorum]|uniref:Uncharacterized protein n=2 Tax=Helicobacter cetorum TaxID=138563 RepID=I0EPM8_HELC0|nr:hypothetical protein [Helicobacter cetorum]ABS86831.1 hypothetical protein pz34w [Helicobacter cetorum]AFI04897.1 hypothetical protein HCW_08200 [Helicobacter cetorum MIT 00-7128]